MLRISRNIPSLNAQTNLAKSTDLLKRTYERLSSGLRITRPSDDAAGLAVATSLKADSRINNQGIRNVNDAIGYLRIAEGAMSELSSILIRIEELANQAANGTLTTTQRRSLDSEAQALRDEYGRIALTTSFNGKLLLDNSNPSLTVSAGGYLVNFDTPGLQTGAAGDGTFKGRVSYTTGGQPRSVAAGDFNGDGILDMASANYGSSTVGIYLGNGDGSFKTGSVLSGGASSYLSVEDLNADGVLDLVTVEPEPITGRVSTFLGIGNGTFQTRTSFVAGNVPLKVSFGDFNGDGVVDLVTSNISAVSSVNLLLGNGDGSFKARAVIMSGASLGSMSVADFTGDGILDLAVFDHMFTALQVLAGNGNGTFGVAGSYSIAGGGISGSTFGDLNNDGYVDLISADQGSSTISVFLNNGNGTFKARQSFSTGTSPRSVTVGDFTGDGVLDLATADYTSGTLSVFVGNGNGSFLARTSLSVGTNPAGVIAADLTGDGILDLASADQGSNRLSVLIGNGSVTSTLSPFNLLSRSTALETLDQMKEARRTVSLALGLNGAYQSRLETITSTLRVKLENYESAASQILDADMATEAAGLTKSQILQRAGSAVLAQANLQPNIALSLL
jgi:flagellin-like hook-associated protein FlgL